MIDRRDLSLRAFMKSAARRVAAKLGIHERSLSDPRWDGTDDILLAARTLARWAEEEAVANGTRGWVLSVGIGDSFQRQVDHEMGNRGLEVRDLTINDVSSFDRTGAERPAIIICALSQSRLIFEAARALLDHPVLANVRLEYVAGLDNERRVFERLDEYGTTWFVSPVLLSERTPYDIYEESLTLFEQKCGLRDYLDLYQFLSHIAVNNVAGDVLEFGSYRGHSGYLIARTLEELGNHRRIYMFDMFENFPEEELGVDQFWSRTHDVAFRTVEAKMSRFANVQLVKGDFLKTFDPTRTPEIALAYIDCDSYRATGFLLDSLLPRMNPNSVIILEDYGHPALLGNRLAVHNSLDARPGYLRYFSQFSGLYIILRLG